MNGDQLYAWQVLEDDAWGMISAGFAPGLSDQTPLISRSLQVAHVMGLAAVAHHDATGLPIRCVRLAVVETIREVP